MSKNLFLVSLIIISISGRIFSQEKETKKTPTASDKPAHLKSETYNTLEFRSLGPAVTSGRIVDLAVNPFNKNEWYIAAGAGGVFKTKNAGVTFEPIGDAMGSYSIGCVTIDKINPNIVWVGSGENNNQRAVGYGDGVYKSEDAGKSFKNVGLTQSEHIGMIATDPNNSDVVYVAAYGPVWKNGGERGIYKTTDGGKTWKQILQVSENTGFNEIHIHPKNPNILFASAHQRRRHEWTYISGGPESAIYKSTDAGVTWTKLTNGLPGGDVGRITIAIPPSSPEIVYAMCEGRDNKGFYKSTDYGASFEKQSNKATDGNYYQEIFADPKNADKIFVMDTWLNVTTDGGKTFKGLGERNKHVDNHVIWIDPDNTKHYLVGCDGGLYESFDGAATWRYFGNLPLTQFYRVCVDNSKPFYYVYAGTQDNNTLGGPSRTISGSGIINADWFVTTGGDGFQSRVDPKEPNIIYSESQYGGLVRFDKKSGETVDIRPMEKQGEPAYRFNWDAPIIISNFDNKRIYFAANKVFRSNDRGNEWQVISPDLSRGIDRNKLPVMGRVWSMDAVAKNASTSIFGNITSLSESPKNEKIIWAGTDDGLIHVTDNGGSNWTKIDRIAGIPQIQSAGYTMQPLVNYILASMHNESVAFAVFNNHRQGDFKPYLIKTIDKGKTWTSIATTLPDNGPVYSIAEDHINPNLLFCGTEFGFYFSSDGGTNWIELKGGLPASICVKDIAIQREENDIVIATFGRGLFVLDNYAILQQLTKEDFNKKATVFPIKDGLVYNESTPYGHTGKSFQGESFFTARNPEIGATFYYNLKNDSKTIKELRIEAEKEKNKNKQDVYYPSADSIRLEDTEEPAYILAVITDEQGNEVRKYKQPTKKGLYKLTWDGRYALTFPVNFKEPDTDNPYYSLPKGQPAVPGKYYVQLWHVKDATAEPLTDKAAFQLKVLNQSTLPLPQQESMLAYNKELAELRRVVLGTNDYYNGLKERLKYMKKAITVSNANTLSLLNDVNACTKTMNALDLQLNGDASLSKREFETLSGFLGAMEDCITGSWYQSLGATQTQKEKLGHLKTEFKNIYTKIVELKTAVEAIEQKAENLKMPATINRLPKWDF